MRHTYKYFCTALVALMVTLSFSVNAQNFEGVITMTTTDAAKGEQAKLEWLTSKGNDKMIINSSVEGMSINYALLFLKGSSSAYMLTEVDGEKVKFDVPASSFGNPEASASSAAAITKGSTATVSGFETTKYELESADGHITVWLSEQLPFTTAQIPAFLNRVGLFKTLSDNNIKGVPVKIIAKDANGKQLYSQTITAVSAKPISASEFTLEGYGDGQEKMKNAVQQQ